MDPGLRRDDGVLDRACRSKDKRSGGGERVPMSLLKNFATVGAGTASSRILGFIRDMFIAAALGTGPVAEAYFVAQRIPNLFRRLFAEGAFASAFVPLFTKLHESEGGEAARKFAV